MAAATAVASSMLKPIPEFCISATTYLAIARAFASNSASATSATSDEGADA